MGALSNPISFSIRISKHFLFSFQLNWMAFHKKLVNWSRNPKTPIWVDFLHFHDCRSGAQHICFEFFIQRAKLETHIIGQICDQDQNNIYICSKLTDRAIIAFRIAPKWQKAANGGFCKFGSFQPYLTHRQLDWSTMMFIESPFLDPSCPFFLLI